MPVPDQLTGAPTGEDPRAELERLRKMKRLQELEAKASGQAPAQPVPSSPPAPQANVSLGAKGEWDLSKFRALPPQPTAPGVRVGGPSGQFSGMKAEGNINLANRPQVRNSDGSISSVRSMSFGTDQGEVLVPTVSDDGRIMSEQEAMDQYRRTGRHLGIFDTPDNATAYAEALHNAQANFRPSSPTTDPFMAMLKPEARTAQNQWRLNSSPSQTGAPFMTAAQRQQLDNERTFGQEPIDRAAIEQAILDKQQNSPEGRKARREAAAAYGAGSDFIQTVDAGGNTRPSGPTDAINYDLQKGIVSAPIRLERAAVGGAQAAVNFLPDVARSIASVSMGDMQQKIGRADFSGAQIPVPEQVQSVSGDLGEALAQFIMTRGVIGKAMPGGGLASELGKDALATGVGFEPGSGRMADMIDPNAIPAGPLRDYANFLRSQPDDSPLWGRFKNALEDLTFAGPAVAPQTAIRGVQAVNRVFNPAEIPTNAGGARPGAIDTTTVEPPPVTAVPPTAPRQRTAPAATPAPAAANPSVSPVASTPFGGNQAGTASAGQQAGSVPFGGNPGATLNASPTVRPAALSREDAAIARDTNKAVGRFMRGARIPRNLVDNYTASLASRFEVLQSDRYPLAFFIEEDLPQFLQQAGYSAADARNLAGDVAAKIAGWGKAANSFNAAGNSSRYTMNNTIHQLTTSQKTELEATFRQALGDESLIGRSDEIGALMRQNGEQAYTNSISEANRILREGKAKPEQQQAAAELKAILQNKGFSEFYPETLQIEAATRGKTVDELIQERIAADPIDTAHWMQSKLGEAERQARNVDGSSTNMSVAYGDMRKAILQRLEKFDGYKGARMQHGDLFGADDAISFGDRFISTARSEYKTDLMAREFAALSPRQQEVAAMSIRDALLNPLLRGSPEDAAARITELQKEGTLKALTTVLGPERGEVLRDAISSTRLENQRIAAISQAHGSPTHLNQQGAKDAIDNLRGPGNRTAHAIGNPAGWGMAAGLSMAMGNPLPLAAKAAGSLFDVVTTPGRKFQSNVTKGLFGLPEAADEAVAALPSPDAPPANAFNATPGGPSLSPGGSGGNAFNTAQAQSRPRATRPPPTADEWAARIRKDEDELQRLLRNYDKIDRADPNVDDLMRDNLHKQRLAKRRIADKTKKMEAARAAQPEPAPTNAPQIEPPANAFNATAEAAPEAGASSTTPTRNGFNQTNASPTVNGILIGGGLGAMAPAENDQDRARNALIGAGVGGTGGALAGKFGSGRKAPRPVENPNALANAGAARGRSEATSSAFGFGNSREPAPTHVSLEPIQSIATNELMQAHPADWDRIIGDTKNAAYRLPHGVNEPSLPRGYVTLQTRDGNYAVSQSYLRQMRDSGTRMARLNSFGGVNAETADLHKLVFAKEMEAAGESPEKIFYSTGWFKQHGDWKFEIPDSQAKFKAGTRRPVENGRRADLTGRLGDKFSHPQAAKAYPSYTGIPMRGKIGAGVEPSAEMSNAGMSVNAPDLQTARTSVLHEGQHAIQNAENFSRGGSPEDFAKLPVQVANDARVLKAYIERAGGADNWNEGVRLYTEATGKIPTITVQTAARTMSIDDLVNAIDPEGAYRRLAGEVEARNVEMRDAMRARGEEPGYPWETQDTPDANQIVNRVTPPTAKRAGPPSIRRARNALSAIKNSGGIELGSGVIGSGYGYTHPVDANDDGVIDDNDRLMTAMVLGFTGLTIAGLANGGPGGGDKARTFGTVDRSTLPWVRVMKDSGFSNRDVEIAQIFMKHKFAGRSVEEAAQRMGYPADSLAGKISDLQKHLDERGIGINLNDVRIAPELMPAIRAKPTRAPAISRDKLPPKDIITGRNDGDRPVDIGMDIGLPDDANIKSIISGEQTKLRAEVRAAKEDSRLSTLARRWEVTEDELEKFLLRKPTNAGKFNDSIDRIVGFAEMAERSGTRTSPAAIAERLGMERGTVNVMLSLARTGKRYVEPALLKRLRALRFDRGRPSGPSMGAFGANAESRIAPEAAESFGLVEDATQANLVAAQKAAIDRGEVPPVYKTFRLPDGRIIAWNGDEARGGFNHAQAREILGLGNMRLEHGQFKWGDNLSKTNWYDTTGEGAAPRSVERRVRQAEKEGTSAKDVVMDSTPEELVRDLREIGAVGPGKRVTDYPRRRDLALSPDNVKNGDTIEWKTPGGETAKISFIPSQMSGAEAVDFTLNGRTSNVGDSKYISAAEAKKTFERAMSIFERQAILRGSDQYIFTGSTPAHNRFYANYMRRLGAPQGYVGLLDTRTGSLFMLFKQGAYDAEVAAGRLNPADWNLIPSKRGSKPVPDWRKRTGLFAVPAGAGLAVAASQSGQKGEAQSPPRRRIVAPPNTSRRQ